MEQDDLPLAGRMTVRVEFVEDGKPVDPPYVDLVVRDPDGVETIFTLERGEVQRSKKGCYFANLVIYGEGLLWWKWVGPGADQVWAPVYQ